MKNFILLSFLVFSTQSFAKNAVQELLDQKSDLSPYEILKEFHQSSGEPASKDELNQFDVDTRETLTRFKSCVYSTGSELSNTGFSVFKVTEVIPAVPAKGPLFPGTPTQYISASGLILGYAYLLDHDQALRTTKSSMWVVGSNLHLQYVYQDELLRNVITVKRHGDLISFAEKRSFFDGSERVFESYGYCWND